MGHRLRLLPLAAAALVAALAACTDQAPTAPVPIPPQRPATSPKPEPRPERSEASLQLSAYYARVQADLLTQGLLRTDGGGPDAPFTVTDLIRNFERIAFYDEYARGAGFRRSDGTAGRLKRWPGPVRYSIDFGRHVSAEQRARDRAEVTQYVERLQRISGHPIGMSEASPNFHVLIMGEDDRASLPARVRSIVPNINPQALEVFRTLPRSIHCFVIAFSGSEGGYDYAKAIALIRAEHPPLMRRSCFHEELAQGLGLANDSPRARPSIFNDDDEFAYLTTQDEIMLRMLYDPRLHAGMTLEEARPIIRRMAAEAMGESG
ncbi:DUF2927 domain-containing protein [Aquicoccus sp. SCR17]|nr:DUF2927 domain-containing protein [Carideicomes alvinocaridis]